MKNEKSLNVLLVEDDKMNAEVLKKFIKSNAKVDELEVQTINEVDRVLTEIQKSELKPQVIILSEPANGKIKFANEVPSRINQIKKLIPASEVIVLSTPNKVETVIDTFRSGAYDVVLKDEHTSKNVVNSIHRFLTGREEKSAAKKQKELSTTY